ncbi:hypothetical protein LIER_06474 [Lithospermum erythrorhizon]|uniref:Tf2-1-like SH3-like domain-containing protein n=1 Tax=Lithospermum erythrorhizon TaxID=34254 RepID=A0AAV3P984_LITER
MCQRLGIVHKFAPTCYPQYNGQVEVMNRTIFLGIKKNLLESGAKCYEEDQNSTRMREMLDFNNEGKDRAIVKMQKYKQTMAKFFNRMVKNRYFVIGDLVLRMFKASRAKDVNKLNPKWEGPYRVKKVVGPGTYRLEELSGKKIEHTWHGIYLKKYYV